MVLTVESPLTSEVQALALATWMSLIPASLPWEMSDRPEFTRVGVQDVRFAVLPKTTPARTLSTAADAAKAAERVAVSFTADSTLSNEATEKAGVPP